MVRMRSFSVLAALVLIATTANAGILINEVDYDQPSTDAAEWVELYNPDPTPMALTGLELVMVNGNGCVEYATYDLDAITIPAGGFVVVGNHPCADPSVTFPATNAIQNGAPDGLLIRDRLTGAVLDDLEYEASSGPVCLVQSIATTDLSSEVDYSIQRCPGGSWVGGPSSPCAANTGCPVTVDPSSWGTLKSQF